MKITALGHSSFKITGKSDNGENITVITDPFDAKMLGFNYPTTEPDIVSISHQHPDHNSLDKIKAKNENLFVADTPGEFEINDLRIYGHKSFHDDKEGKERGSNTIFTYDFKEARIAHLGDLGHELNSNLIEELENIEILFVPVGEGYTMNTKAIMSVIDDLEPLIVIPMHYKTDKHSADFKDLLTLEQFYEKTGYKGESKDEIVIKDKSDLPSGLTIVPLNF